MSDETGGPALTPEEWADRACEDKQVDPEYTTTFDAQGDPSILTVTPLELLHDGDWEGDFGVGLGGRQRIDIQRRHALAALCLHGQPYGFTWADVDELRGDWHERDCDTVREIPFPCNCGCAVLNAIADRIAALLPPRP